jgi:hypothetical protein
MGDLAYEYMPKTWVVLLLLLPLAALSLCVAGPNGTLEATWGGMGDLAYEYMLKTWVLSGGRDQVGVLVNPVLRPHT